MNLKINYIKENKGDKFPLITITDNKIFDYSMIRNMYRPGHGHGIQVTDIKYEKVLLEMCDKISDIIDQTKVKMDLINGK